MGIRAKDLRECVIRPVLQELELWSPEAEELMLLTAAQESQLGYYLRQVNGPALGIYQVEPATYRDIWRYIMTKPQLERLVLGFAVYAWNANQYSELTWNLRYSTAIARVKYAMIPEPIPTTLTDQAKYWKRHYNTSLGKGTVDEAIKNYSNLVLNGT